MTALSDLFEVEASGGSDSPREFRCTLPPDAFAEGVALTARALVQRRLPSTSSLRTVWEAQHAKPATEVATKKQSELLVNHVCQNVGTPDELATDEHLGGAVAETLWVEFVTDLDEGLGPPVRVEGHDWSSTDPGGDGLTVHEVGGSFAFRLWESKHHVADAPVRSTVGRACRQVRDQSLSYLARFSLVAQYMTEDDPLALFYAELTERWVDQDPGAGVGISIGTGATADVAQCFDSLDSYFGLPTDRHHGHLHVVNDFMAFCHAVRDEVWKGCGLWTGH